MTTSKQKKFVKNEKLGGISMKKLIKKRLNQKGLTLIELLAVIVILAIIAAIAIPAIGNIINKQRDKAAISDAQSVIAAAKIAYSDGACNDDTAPDTCSKTELEDYLDKKIKDAKVAEATISGGAWSVKYSSGRDFKVITSGKIPKLKDGSEAVEESELIKAMDK